MGYAPSLADVRETATPRLVVLEEVIRASWDAETSDEPALWSPQSPAVGQGVVTALVVQDLLGGTVWRTTVGGQRHHYVEVDPVLVDPEGLDGVVDLTREQFASWMPTPVVPVMREALLSSPEVARRYRVLAGRVQQVLHATAAA